MNADKMNLNQNKKYLETHNVTKYVEELMASLMKEKPDEPLLFMMKFIQKKAQQNGINIPMQSRVDVSDGDIRFGGGQTQLAENSRAYDKPWLNVSKKKSDNKNSFQQDVVKDIVNINTISTDSSNDVKCNLDEEFRLVNDSSENNENIGLTNIEEYRLSKLPKTSSKTKGILLEIMKEREDNKMAEKQKLEEKMAEKSMLSEEYDCAVELAEDQDINQGEFNVSNPVNNKSKTTVVVRKEIADNTSDMRNDFKFKMCPNCTKLYQLGDHNSSVGQHSSTTLIGNSVIFDDLESASQVNGPRPISDIYMGKDRSGSSKKKISVTDFEKSAKGWPVLDTGSESSLEKRNIPRPRPSSRHFQT